MDWSDAYALRAIADTPGSALFPTHAPDGKSSMDETIRGTATRSATTEFVVFWKYRIFGKMPDRHRNQLI
jgi:hypothetical protein